SLCLIERWGELISLTVKILQKEPPWGDIINKGLRCATTCRAFENLVGIVVGVGNHLARVVRTAVWRCSWSVATKIVLDGYSLFFGFGQPLESIARSTANGPCACQT